MELMYFSMEKNNNKKKETHSDYSIKMQNNDPNAKYKSDFVGGCWIRKNDDGSEWLSCSIDPEKIPKAVMQKCFGEYSLTEFSDTLHLESQQIKSRLHPSPGLFSEVVQSEMPGMPEPKDTENYDDSVPF